MRAPYGQFTRRSAIALGAAVVIAAIPVVFIAATWYPPDPPPRGAQPATEDDATPDRPRDERRGRREQGTDDEGAPRRDRGQSDETAPIIATPSP